VNPKPEDHTIAWNTPRGMVYVFEGSGPALGEAMGGALRVLDQPIVLPGSFIGYDKPARAVVETINGVRSVRVIEGNPLVIQWAFGPYWGNSVQPMPAALVAALSRKPKAVSK
jgi:hypothetical protein